MKSFEAQYRNNGAIGALLDEYEKAINELIDLIRSATSSELPTVVDHDTQDEDCRSIQTILTHIIQSGYTYAIEIRKWMGEKLNYEEKYTKDTVEDYCIAISQMFEYTEQVFTDYPNIKLEEKEDDKKILVRWGQRFDVDQLMEHAIVHILRHRRQIERFLLKLRK